MPDLEKVIKGLECFTNVYPSTTWGECKERNCSYLGKDCELAVMADALELLKAQEPVKAIADGEDSYICNNCGTVIGWAELEPGGIEEVKYKFCPECGRAVKWE